MPLTASKGRSYLKEFISQMLSRVTTTTLLETPKNILHLASLFLQPLDASLSNLRLSVISPEFLIQAEYFNKKIQNILTLLKYDIVRKRKT